MDKQYDIKKIESIFSEDFSSSLYTILADLYIKNGDIDRAYTVCKIGLEHHPDDLSGLFILAKIELLQNKISDSQDILMHIINQFPLHINAHKLLVEIFKKQRNKKQREHHEKILNQLLPKRDKGPSKSKAIKNKNTKVDQNTSPKRSIKSKKSTNQKFKISEKMATFTLVGILIKQKHYEQALKVLDILEKQGKSKKTITQKRNSIKKAMSDG